MVYEQDDILCLVSDLVTPHKETQSSASLGMGSDNSDLPPGGA